MEPENKKESNEDAVSVSNKRSRFLAAIKVDTYMLPAKITYFFSTGKEGSILPFIMPFLVGIGLTPAEAGLIVGVRLIGMILGGPFWGYIGDKYQNHKHLMLIIVTSSVILIGGQPFISMKLGDPTKNICPLKTAESNNTATDTDKNDGEVSYVSLRFFVMMFINIVASFFDGNITSMTDTGVVQRIHVASEKKDFGWNRFFGAIGFSTGSFLSGFASDFFPSLNINCFSGAICVYVAFCIGIIISSRFLYVGKSKLNLQNRDEEKVGESAELNLKEKVFNTFKSVDVIMFFSTVFISGLLQGISASFTALRLKELEAPSTLIGLTFSIASISCFPFLIFSFKVIRILGGEWNTIIVGCFSYVIRFVAFAYIENPWYAIPINSLQSLGFGLAIVTFILYVKNVANPYIFTTMISIMNGTFFGLGFIAANIIGGQIYHTYKGSTLFASFGTLAGVWTLILIFFRISQRVCQKTRTCISHIPEHTNQNTIEVFETHNKDIPKPKEVNGMSNEGIDMIEEGQC